MKWNKKNGIKNEIRKMKEENEIRKWNEEMK